MSAELKNNLKKLVKIIEDFTRKVENCLPEEKKQVILGHNSSGSTKGGKREEVFHRTVNRLKDEINEFINSANLKLPNWLSFILKNDKEWDDRGENNARVRTGKLALEISDSIDETIAIKLTSISNINWTPAVKEKWKELFSKYQLNFGLKETKGFRSKILKRYLWESGLNFPDDCWLEKWEKELKDYLNNEINPRLEALHFENPKILPNLKKKFVNLFNWLTENDGDLENPRFKEKLQEFYALETQLGINGSVRLNKESLKEVFLKIRELRKWMFGLDLEWKLFNSKEEAKKYFEKPEVKAIWGKNNFSDFLITVVRDKNVRDELREELLSENQDFFSVTPLISRGDNILTPTLLSVFETNFRRMNGGPLPENEDDAKENDNNSNNTENQATTEENNSEGKNKQKPPPTFEQLEQETEQENQQKSAQKEAETENAIKDFQKAKNIEEKLKALQEAMKNAMDQSYQKNQTAVENAEKEVAAADPIKASQSFVEILDQWMDDNEIANQNELGSEISTKYEELKGNAITEPDLMVEIKHQISAKIGEVGSQKRFTKLVDKVENSLRTGQKINEVGKELFLFLKSTNVYDQALIAKEQKRLNELKSALENSINQSSASKPEEFPWKVVVPIVFGGVLLIGLVVILRKKRNKIVS